MKIFEKRIFSFSGRKVAVVGDMVADEYIYGESSRVSREAPVVILKHSHDSVLPGGAANAAHNVAALGGTVYPIGVVGGDAYGCSIMDIFAGVGANTNFIVSEMDRKTVSKTRILGCGHHTTYQQLVRVDRDDDRAISEKTEHCIIANTKKAASEVDAIIVSDYHHGVFTPAVVSCVNDIARAGDIPVFVDSRFELLKFSSFFSATPNETEVEDIISGRLDEEVDVRDAACTLLEKTGGKSILITRGNKGMCLLERGGVAKFIPVHGTDEIADVTGAGDTVISVYTLAVASGASTLEAAYLANIAGGLVVLKRGTATVSQEELIFAAKGAVDFEEWRS